MAMIRGSALDDLVIGTPDADVLNGLARDDHLLRGEGADQLFGGDGDDRLEGGG
jgi:Ca2+-binding RTX toxin-like protein